MWTLRLMSGKEITVSEAVVESIIVATDQGVKFIRIKEGLVISPSTITEMISDEEKLNFNPILNDPDWKIHHDSSDYRRANLASERLDRKFPLPKFQKEWDEANATLKALVNKND